MTQYIYTLYIQFAFSIYIYVYTYIINYIYHYDSTSVLVYEAMQDFYQEYL